MLKSQMRPEQRAGFYDWINAEWHRCDVHRATIENHAITYLMTGNGGAAAAVIAFAGAAGYATNSVYLTLSFFLLGLFFTGCGISIGMRRLSSTTRELAEDHRAFNGDKIRSSELEEKHRMRFRKRGLGSFFGWFAWFCFIAGIAFSGFTFNEFMADKRAKAAQEKAGAMQLMAQEGAKVKTATKQPPTPEAPKEKTEAAQTPAAKGKS